MIPVTISFGVAASTKARMKDVDSLVKAADEALYRAKMKGRNRVEVAPDDGIMT
jgi:diguanylate cyclase (GGDEF)-like protein